MQVRSLGWEDPLEEKPTPEFLLKNPMDRRARQATGHGVTGLDTIERLSTKSILCTSQRVKR